MSHFCVYVFGNPENIESKLAPYDENMEVEKYKVEPVSEDEKLRFLNYYNEKEGNENEINLDSFETMYKKYGDEWNGNCWEKEEDIWYEFSTYNPNSKWDWWTAGGRWEHSIPTKDNSKSLDFVYAINEVDFAAQIEKARETAAMKYDIVHENIDLTDFVKWEIIRKENADDIEKAKEIYHAQKATKAYRKLILQNRNYFSILESIENYLVDKESFLDDFAYSNIAPYAFIDTNGNWNEKGQMGWWGISNDNMSNEEWGKKFLEYVKSLPEDTLFTQIDCHI